MNNTITITDGIRTYTSGIEYTPDNEIHPYCVHATYPDGTMLTTRHATYEAAFNEVQSDAAHAALVLTR